MTFGSRSKLPPRHERDWVTSHELMADAGITFRQLDYWTTVGFLVALEAANPGAGRLRRYHPSQVRRAQVAVALTALGMPLAVVLDVIDDLLDTGHADLGPIHLAYQIEEVPA